MIPQTLAGLAAWMEAHCSNGSYAIGDQALFEGFGVAADGDGFCWYFTERGKREILQTFRTEAEAAAHAFEAVRADPLAWRHLAACVREPALLAEVTAELARRNLPCWTDQIPYGGPDDLRYRVFVSGCDIRLAADLQAAHAGC
jgi:hypothetical protein